MIKRLPREVEGKLRSGVAVPSLQQCVEELVLNSIDAGATCVGVRVDMESLKVQVIDNGSGMSAEDMECVGTRYHTSKCSCVEDLDNLRWYGFRGEALASILSLASLVEISTRTRSSVKTHVKMFKSGKGMGVFEAETARPSAGTTVIVCNLFHSMPVRRKRVDAVLEGERVRHRVEAVSLMHPSVSFTLRNDCTGTMMVQLGKANNTHHRFAQIHSNDRARKLGEIDPHTHGQFEVTGYIGREGHYNNSLQFLYVNGRLLLKTRIHKLLNILLRRLSGSAQKSDSPDGHSGLRSPKQKRSQELHGVYIMNIKCPYSEYDICLDPAKTLIEFKDWDGILLCVEEAVKAFLTRENLLAVLFQEDLDCTNQDDDKSVNGEKTATMSSTLDCSIGVTLASESVHRPLKDVGVPENTLFHERKEEAAKIQSQECDKESIDKQQLSLPHLESMCEEEKGLSEAGDSQIICTSTQVRPQENETNETEIRLNNATSERNLNSSPDVDFQQEAGQTPSLINNRKIRLSDPFIHQSLQTQNKSVFQQQNLAEKSQGRFFTSKNKISLDSHQDICSQRPCASVVPPKIPRIECCQRISLWKESGSLDKFRRIFGKSHDIKVPSQQTLLQNTTKLPQKSELQGSLQNATISEAIAASNQNNGKNSLAAKICLMKQQKPVCSNVSPDFHESTSEAKTFPCTSDHDVQDRNNNENLCEPSTDHEPVSGYDTSLPLPDEEEDTTAGDWLHHYDTTVGKVVYVNTVTGLSKYEERPSEDTQVLCTSDVTNMAVSVVSETGVEYRCYPFQVDLVLPFLPKSRTERVISAGLDSKVGDDEIPNSLSSMYSKWNNPVFVQPPTVGLNVSSGQADGLAVKIHNILFPYRFSKAMIQSMKVICQVDKKFLACLLNTRDEEPAAQSETEGNLLVLVDQHAAHERVRLESLVADSYTEDTGATGERCLRSANISPPLEIDITEEELRLLRSCQAHLQYLGLQVEFSQASDPRVFVWKVPLCFMERENNELKRGRSSVIKPIVEEYLREQTELLRSAGRVRATLPLTVLKVLASLACHGAIKFNHSLSREECLSLVESLSSCQLPFQCAHGRPSIIPLVDFQHLDKDQKELQKPNLQKLRRMHKAWQLFGNG